MSNTRISPAEQINAAREKHHATNRKRKKKLDYHRAYNADHASELSEAKKKRYRTDPAYRQAILARNVARYQRQQLLKKKIEEVCPPPLRQFRKMACCPTCHRPLPTLSKPHLMLIDGTKKGVPRKFEVMMFPIGELARHIGKQARTVDSWIKDGVLSEAQYKNASMRRRWTQDQAEAIMSTCDKFDLRPPVSFEKIGFIREVREALQALAPLGIDPAKYTTLTDDGRYRRDSQELSPPIYTTEELLHGKKTKKSHAKKKTG
jgi:hypothetical protein